MIKKVCMFLMLLFVPTFCFGEWVGTHDGRRYVTDTEKNQYPYNLIVRIETEDGWATGTFVSPNVILTCRHCIEGVDLNETIDFYTTDGVKHQGMVAYYKKEDKMTSDFALIVTKKGHGNRFPFVPSKSVPDSRAIRIGYDSLKIMTDKEIAIVHQVFNEIIDKYGTIDVSNVWDALDDVEETVYKNWICKSESDTDCVRCSKNGCLFDDGDRLKVQDSCSATSLQRVQGGGEMLVTQCATNQGGSGGPLFSNDKLRVLGVISGAMGFELGAKATPNTLAVKADEFSKPTEEMINMVNNGLIEY